MRTIDLTKRQALVMDRDNQQTKFYPILDKLIKTVRDAEDNNQKTLLYREAKKSEAEFKDIYK
jgi:hypothetical protein